MNAWWIGTVSTVIGAVTGALLQAWRERVAHRRQLAVRWDQTLLDGLADYLATADRAVRALLRWRHVRAEGGDGLAEVATTATGAFESVHEKSHLITLLTGDRDHPVRAAAREMRQALLPLCQEVQGRTPLPAERVDDLVRAHHRARDTLVRAVQRELKR